MKARTLASLLFGVLLLGLAGCGDDDGEETVTQERTVTTTEPEPTVAEPTPQPAPTPSAVVGPQHFQTPSGNIGCYVDTQHARCDIAERDWNPPPPPSDCQLDWGQGLIVDKETASFVCAGDTTLGGPATLPYGSASQRGDFRCESEEAGVTCYDIGDDNGFVISRENYRIF